MASSSAPKDDLNTAQQYVVRRLSHALRFLSFGRLNTWEAWWIVSEMAADPDWPGLFSAGELRALYEMSAHGVRWHERHPVAPAA